MIRLTEITEDNWLEAAGLNVSGKQKNFVAPDSLNMICYLTERRRT